MRTLVHCALEGRLADARAFYNRLRLLMDANFLESNPAPVKAALALMGRCDNVVRLPLLPVQAETEEHLLIALRALSGPPVAAAPRAK
jgi:4-hydroxy-tetrahydrodipicolinate synthase